MELVNMFVAKFTNGNLTGSSLTQGSSGKFNDFLTSAENSTKNLNNSSNKKTYSKKDKSFDSYNNKTDYYKDDNKQKVSSEDNSNDNDNNNNKSDDNKVKDKTILINNNILDQLSNIMEIPQEQIVQILAELSMPISSLSDGQNLIEFIQEAFEVENPVDLLSMNNVKDIMTQVKDLASDIDYKDIITSDENLEDILSSLNQQGNLQQDFTLLNDGENDITQEISDLLNSLNGKVISTSESNATRNKHSKEKVSDEDILETSFSTELNSEFGEDITLQMGYGNNGSQSSENLLQNGEPSESSEQQLDNTSITSFENTFTSKIYNATLPKTQALRNINSTEVINQIIEKMKVSVKQDISEVKILLTPEQLGEVSLKIALHNGVVTAKFIAESEKVKEIIESNFNQLKDLLLDKGIDVGELQVSVSDNGRESLQNFEQSQQKSSKRLEDIITKSYEEDEEDIKNTSEAIIESQVNYSV